MTVTGQEDICDDQWHHVAAVRDPAATRLALYIDGILVASAPCDPGEEFFVPHAAITGGVGDVVGRAPELFCGVIDEIRISSISRRFKPIPGAEGATAIDENYALENDVVTFTFARSGSSLYLAELIDKASGRNLVLRPNDEIIGRNLWRIRLSKGSDISRKAHASAYGSWVPRISNATTVP